jgi:serine/threonine-protein kinase
MPPNRPTPTVSAVAAAATGMVRFKVEPWAVVECQPNNYRFGSTPFSDQSMRVGHYECTFTHPQLGTQTRAVDVTANQRTKVLVKF